MPSRAYHASAVLSVTVLVVVLVCTSLMVPRWSGLLAMSCFHLHPGLSAPGRAYNAWIGLCPWPLGFSYAAFKFSVL